MLSRVSVEKPTPFPSPFAHNRLYTENIMNPPRTTSHGNDANEPLLPLSGHQRAIVATLLLNGPSSRTDLVHNLNLSAGSLTRLTRPSSTQAFFRNNPRTPPRQVSAAPLSRSPSTLTATDLSESS